MSRLAAALAACVLLLAAPPATAGELAAVTSPSGVAVQASLADDGRLEVAILPTEGVRLNGRLGVSFAAVSAPEAWSEELPRVVLGPGDYFEEPVFETLVLAPGGPEAPAALAVTFGSCLPVTGICVLEETAITVRREPDGRLAVELAMLEP